MTPVSSRPRVSSLFGAGQLPGGDAVAAGVFSMIQSKAFWDAVKEVMG